MKQSFANPSQSARCASKYPLLHLLRHTTLHVSILAQSMAETAADMSRTKFPIKSLPNLKTLAADLTPIPVPQTIPPPKPKKEKERREGKENGAKDQVREEIVID